MSFGDIGNDEIGRWAVAAPVFYDTGEQTLFGTSNTVATFLNVVTFLSLGGGAGGYSITFRNIVNSYNDDPNIAIIRNRVS